MRVEGLAARAGLDLLNSIEVSADIVRWRKAPRPIASRVWAKVTGQTRRLDDIFDGHVQNGLADLAFLVASLRDSMTESDTVLARAIEKLRLAQNRIALHEKGIGELRSQLSEMEEELRRELRSIWERLDTIDAQLGVDRTLSWLEERAGAPEFGFADIWRAFDELWWGKFGALLRRAPSETATLKISEYCRRVFRKIVGQRFDINAPIPLISLLATVPSISETELEVLELITLEPQWALRPLTSSVIARSSGIPDFDREAQWVPLVTTADRIADRLIEEAKRGTG